MRIWAFESPDSDTRFKKYGALKFTYTQNIFCEIKTTNGPKPELTATQKGRRGGCHELGRRYADGPPGSEIGRAHV